MAVAAVERSPAKVTKKTFVVPPFVTATAVRMLLLYYVLGAVGLLYNAKVIMKCLVKCGGGRSRNQRAVKTSVSVVADRGVSFAHRATAGGQSPESLVETPELFQPFKLKSPASLAVSGNGAGALKGACGRRLDGGLPLTSST